MSQLERGAREQQAGAAEVFGEQAVVPALAIGGVADDGVGQMLQMAAQLVAAAAFRVQFDQGVAAARVAVNLPLQFGGGQPAEAGEGALDGGCRIRRVIGFGFAPLRVAVTGAAAAARGGEPR